MIKKKNKCEVSLNWHDYNRSDFSNNADFDFDRFCESRCNVQFKNAIKRNRRLQSELPVKERR